MSREDLIGLAELKKLTAGSPAVSIGLIDGPVAVDHADFAGTSMRVLGPASACSDAGHAGMAHGTFIAGLLSSSRSAALPGLCPGCVLLIRPVFRAAASGLDDTPTTTPDELAQAILECISAGARILNLSLALTEQTQSEARGLELALNHAAGRGVIVVAAAGNNATLGTSCITRHPWVIPVAACDRTGRPTQFTNLAASLGRRGLMAPGDDISSLGPDSKPVSASGTSVAAPFVTGAIALLWSLFSDASARQLRIAVTEAAGAARRSVTPPVLDGWAAYESLRRAGARPAFA